VIKLKIITIFLIAVSLSMDAFSLALIYGTQGITKKDKLLLSLIVGVYHFIMPLIGVIIGNLITSKILINTNILVGIILSLIAVEMIISSFKETNNKFLLTFPSYLIFGLSVSIDSLTTGIGLSLITKNCIFSSTVFCVTSMLFTYLGLNLGDTLNRKYGKISTILGGMVLFILGFLYILK
jgi:putative Mn2+ efflux pump MntP